MEKVPGSVLGRSQADGSLGAPGAHLAQGSKMTKEKPQVGECCGVVGVEARDTGSGPPGYLGDESLTRAPGGGTGVVGIDWPREGCGGEREELNNCITFNVTESGKTLERNGEGGKGKLVWD